MSSPWKLRENRRATVLLQWWKHSLSATPHALQRLASEPVAMIGKGQPDSLHALPEGQIGGYSRGNRLSSCGWEATYSTDCPSGSGGTLLPWSFSLYLKPPNNSGPFPRATCWQSNSDQWQWPQQVIYLLLLSLLAMNSKLTGCTKFRYCLPLISTPPPPPRKKCPTSVHKHSLRSQSGRSVTANSSPEPQISGWWWI